MFENMPPTSCRSISARILRPPRGPPGDHRVLRSRTATAATRTASSASRQHRCQAHASSTPSAGRAQGRRPALRQVATASAPSEYFTSAPPRSRQDQRGMAGDLRPRRCAGLALQHHASQIDDRSARRRMGGRRSPDEGATWAVGAPNRFSGGQAPPRPPHAARRGWRAGDAAAGLTREEMPRCGGGRADRGMRHRSDRPRAAIAAPCWAPRRRAAQGAWPGRPVRQAVPSRRADRPTARPRMGQRLSEILGQPFIVDNRPAPRAATTRHARAARERPSLNLNAGGTTGALAANALAALWRAIITDFPPRTGLPPAFGRRQQVLSSARAAPSARAPYREPIMAFSSTTSLRTPTRSDRGLLRSISADLKAQPAAHRLRARGPADLRLPGLRADHRRGAERPIAGSSISASRDASMRWWRR